MIGCMGRYPFMVLLSLAAAACSNRDASAPVAQEITSDAVAEFCGMALTEHAGPKAQIFLRSAARPLWFASVHDAFAYTMLLEVPKDIVAIYVNDMAKVKNWDRPEPGTWIDARQATFVIESGRRSGMDENEAVPFSTSEAAAAFVNQHGGRPVSFAGMPKSYILTSSGAELPGRERVSNQ